jgi:hypothetical protein
MTSTLLHPSSTPFSRGDFLYYQYLILSRVEEVEDNIRKTSIDLYPGVNGARVSKRSLCHSSSTPTKKRVYPLSTNYLPWVKEVSKNPPPPTRSARHRRADRGTRRQPYRDCIRPLRQPGGRQGRCPEPGARYLDSLAPSLAIDRHTVVLGVSHTPSPCPSGLPVTQGVAPNA